MIRRPGERWEPPLVEAAPVRVWVKWAAAAHTPPKRTTIRLRRKAALVEKQPDGYWAGA